MNPEVIKKLTSGRFILTICGGAGFLYCMIMKTLPAEAIASILTMIFVSYFQRNDRKKEGQ